MGYIETLHNYGSVLNGANNRGDKS